ncbi:unnamed protein product [Pieris brassicae]|uniref:Uncharacterized protein n=1 Tax=Pieris brassicae TaxID=7116 RepID=A0A9P0XKV0_PIEBR|nr:unnamed protein product [Pieris brassicae]
MHLISLCIFNIGDEFKTHDHDINDGKSKKKQRSTQRGLLTRIEKYVTSRASMSDEDIDARSENLHTAIKSLRELQQAIEDHIVDQHDETAYEQEQEY